MNRDLFVRSKANPIIKPTDLPFNVNGVLNPGVALVENEVVLLLRIENRRGISALHVARSANGVDGWRVEQEALLEPRLREYPYEKWGCEDPRVTQIGPHTCSNDLLHWALPGVLLPANGGPWWDGLKVGSGPPIRTEKGWLLIYHGVKEAGGGHLIYRLGLALLDLDDPRKLLARSSDWIFAPEAEYEQRGLVPDVVYTCGALERDGEIWMYYGGADTVVGLATAKTSALWDFVLEHDYLDEKH